MKKHLLFLITLVLVLSACTNPTPTPEVGQPNITVSILPQVYFVEKIAGDLVNVQAMAGTGDDPHTYEPTADQMRLLTESDLYLTIGVEFEDAWLPRFISANPEMQVVDSAAGVKRISATSNHEEPHGEEGSEAGELDPHIWLSPRLVKQISQNTADALIELNPANTETYQSNLTQWLNEIDQVDADIRTLLQDHSHNHFMVIHPAWGYFAKEYGLEMLAVEAEGQEPGPEELAQLLDLAQAYQINYLFVQKGINLKLAESIASQIGVQNVVELDPMAKDWVSNMRFIASRIAEAVK